MFVGQSAGSTFMNDDHVARSCLRASCRPTGRRRLRSGTTTVELAFVLPVFLVFLFGLWAYGHAQMVSNMLKGATRTAARMGATEGVTSAQVEARIREIMASAIDTSSLSIQIKDASAYDNGGAFPTSGSSMESLPNLELAGAESRTLFMVRATVDYNDVAVLPTSWFKNVQLSGQSFMRHE